MDRICRSHVGGLSFFPGRRNPNSPRPHEHGCVPRESDLRRWFVVLRHREATTIHESTDQAMASSVRDPPAGVKRPLAPLLSRSRGPGPSNECGLRGPAVSAPERPLCGGKAERVRSFQFGGPRAARFGSHARIDLLARVASPSLIDSTRMRSANSRHIFWFDAALPVNWALAWSADARVRTGLRRGWQHPLRTLQCWQSPCFNP